MISGLQQAKAAAAIDLEAAMHAVLLQQCCTFCKVPPNPILMYRVGVWPSICGIMFAIAVFLHLPQCAASWVEPTSLQTVLGPGCGVFLCVRL